MSNKKKILGKII